MAISYNNQIGVSNKPISPCGVCRQSLTEYENIVNHSIRLILAGTVGKVYIIDKATDLLNFSSADMQ
jgi:cytidine deaminase